MITFKQIEMAGFKSFADPTKINFDGGITAIVGPNGCGKSNVADAIRWVLGEQRKKELRGDSMQDVIFAGSEKRKKLSYCEVSILFDNTNKWFNIEYDEVLITRKLYRSGESEYYLNKKLCRLKDITDLLYDSGVGRDGYSIIGQGKVEQIISSKPEDRRTIFEDAAGISKFKARKNEAENKLARYRDNLSRTNDIMTEIERRLGPLKRQAEDAKKSLALRDTLKELEVNAYIYQFDNASIIKEEINVRKKGYNDNLSIKQNEYENLQIKYDANMAEMDRVDKSVNELHDKVLNLTVQLEKKQGESNLLNERMSHIEEQTKRVNAEVKSLQLEHSQLEMLLNNATTSKIEETEKLKQLRIESDRLSSEYLELIDRITENEDTKEASHRAYIDNLAKLTDIKSNMSALLAKRDTMQANALADEEKLSHLKQDFNNLQTEIKQFSNEVDAVETQKNSVEDEITVGKNNLQDLESQLANLNDEIFAYRASITNDTNRRNLLQGLQSNFEGYQFAVKRLLNDSKTNKQLSSSIKGVIGNIIDVKDTYSTAIEIALGSSIQNIVTKNEEDAKVLIDYLKAGKLGRATFLPMTAVKPRSLSAGDKKFLNGKGCLGVASEIISYPSEYSKVIESLLGSTVIVDTLENAVQIARDSGYSFKMVTLDGDVLSPQGSMSGGSKKSAESSLLSKDNEIKALTKNIEKNTKYLDELEQTNKTILEQVVALRRLREENTLKLQQFNTDYASKMSKLQAQQDKLTSLEEEIKQYEAQLSVAKQFIKELQDKIDSVDSLESDITSSQKQMDENSSTTQSMYEQLKSRRENYNTEITDLKIKIASSEEKIKSLEVEIERYTTELSDSNDNIERARIELAKQEQVYNQARQIQQEAMREIDSSGVGEELKTLNAKLASFDQFKSSILSELKDIDEKKGEIQAEISRLQNKLYQEDAKLQKVDIDIENMQERIYEEYEMTYNDCLPFKREEFDIKEGMIEINRIKTQIAALGSININAIEEYKVEGARYEEMSAQVNDLQKAEADLIKIITDLSSEMLQKFNVEFAKINENFTKVFKELFGGGNAHLELLENEDPLQAGVEIKACPPGKALTNISLMSGGEKTMTAIAILFAILKLRPMPFCFLDEIEAALDDANIDRYARYLQRFSQETQFIVITHRKPTMELADSLFGVTMEEKGVSKIVSVKLSEAVKVTATDKIDS
ncbi:MAG: chromosome segregation protein SMC [Clostridia bacterium]|nr:chromosome segregation protein SMC [Clostridia bacterium]